MRQNESGQFLTVLVYEASTGKPKTGIAGTLSAAVSLDGEPWRALDDTTATEENAAIAKGFYKFDLLKTETDADHNLRFSAGSTDPNIVTVCIPTEVDFDSRFSGSSCGLLALQGQQAIGLLQQLVNLQRPGG